MASAWGSSWGTAWGDSWGAMAVAGTQAPTGGTRIPNKYEDLPRRRAKYLAAKRKLDEERRRLAQLKREHAKVEVTFRATPLNAVTNDTTHLTQELSRAVENVALQNARVRDARKAANEAKRATQIREADERELEEAYARFQAEEARAEAARVEAQRVEDEEMGEVLMLVHSL